MLPDNLPDIIAESMYDGVEVTSNDRFGGTHPIQQGPHGQLFIADGGKLPKYAWPGGYPIVYSTEDGGTLCPDCANEGDPDDGPSWAVEGWGTIEGDEEEFCEHCGKRIQ